MNFIIIFKSGLAAVTLGVLILAGKILWENIDQVRRNEVIGRYHSIGLLFAPSVLIVVCLIVIGFILK